MCRVLCLNLNCESGHSKFGAHKQALIRVLADADSEDAKAGSADRCGKFDWEAAGAVVTQKKYYKVTKGIRQMEQT